VVGRFASVNWDRLWKLLWLTARGVTRDCALANDLVQETLLAFWKSPDGWKPAKGCLESYLAGILRKKAIDHFRRQTRVAGSTDDPDGPYSTVRAPDTLEQEAQTMSHWRALERLVAGNENLEDFVAAAQIRPGAANVNQEIGELMGKTPPQVAKLKIKLLAVPGVKELLYGN
jgi:RNA polymerase sigma factor (sigma-70 family)